MELPGRSCLHFLWIWRGWGQSPVQVRPPPPPASEWLPDLVIAFDVAAPGKGKERGKPHRLVSRPNLTAPLQPTDSCFLGLLFSVRTLTLSVCDTLSAAEAPMRKGGWKSAGRYDPHEAKGHRSLPISVHCNPILSACSCPGSPPYLGKWKPADGPCSPSSGAQRALRLLNHSQGFAPEGIWVWGFLGTNQPAGHQWGLKSVHRR